MFLKNKNIIFKIRRSKVTDYAALNGNVQGCVFAKNRPVSLNWSDYSIFGFLKQRDQETFLKDIVTVDKPFAHFFEAKTT